MARRSSLSSALVVFGEIHGYIVAVSTAEGRDRGRDRARAPRAAARCAAGRNDGSIWMSVSMRFALAVVQRRGVGEAILWLAKRSSAMVMLFLRVASRSQASLHRDRREAERGVRDGRPLPLGGLDHLLDRREGWWRGGCRQ